MGYETQIAAFSEQRAAKAAAQKAIMDEAGTKGETLDAQQQEDFDSLQGEIEAIDGHLKRLDIIEKATGRAATPVAGDTAANGAASRGNERIQVKAPEKLEPGIAMARLVKCYGMAKGNLDQAARIAHNRYGETAEAYGLLKGMADRGFQALEKAEVPAGSTVADSWAEDLVGDTTSAFADFVEYLRPQTILGKFGNNGIPSLRRVPFRTPLISQTGGGAGYWVGEGKAKPLTSFDFARTTLEPLKVANICVLTDEVIRSSSPSAEAIVRDQLVEALKARLDIDFIDPAKTASAGVSPASITNAAANGAASGTGDADDVRADIRSILNEYIAANNPPSSGVLIMRSGTALALSMMVNALGQSEFNGIGMNGGTLLSIPVITSEHVPSGIIVMVNASDIYLADEGGFRLDMSREASVEMLDSSLTGDSIGVVPGTAASTVSLWQTNSVGFLAERTINWAARRASAVAYLSGVAWGGAVNDLS
jgi:HK97 family phage major capsid protein